VEVVPGDVQPLEQADTQDGNTPAASDNNQDDTDISDEELAEDATDNSETQDVDAGKPKDNDVVQEELKYYTVVSGDTLADISFKLYNTYTKVKKIMELNSIEDQDLIYVGQKLIVP
jgi:nucleoid-associated protein YgaU